MRCNLIALVATSMILLCACTLFGQAPPRRTGTPDPAPGYAGAPATMRTVPALRLDAGSVPVIDGRLDEGAWARAQPVGDFIQYHPDAGAPASQRTEVRILFDDDALYVAARLHDTAPDSIAAQLARRDDDGYSDWFHVAIDSYHDRRTAFTFGLNPRGVKQDVFLYDDTKQDVSWDAVWDGAARIDSLGWTAEFRIPLSQLRFNRPAAGEEQVWGVNFRRLVARTNEESYWAPLPRDANRLVSLFGELRGLDVRPSRRLEITPYTVTRLERTPGDAGDPFHRVNATGFAAGADLKYGLTSDLTLTATLNPDFGQVEADPSEVNLTAYETFFPEKRPFFVEGADIFRFGVGIGDGDLGNDALFYSRRIGRAPQGELPDAAEYDEVPTATTILGAAKLSGKTRNGWSIGLLEAVTAEETARWADAGGRRERIGVEPLTSYTVGRVIRDFRDGQSAVGAVFTATHRDIDDPNLAFLNRSAYSGGFDARHRFMGGNAELRAWIVGSHIRGDTAAINNVQRSSVHYFQRPDADHLDYDPTRTSLSGWAGSIEVLKQGGGHWRYGGIVNVRSAGFDVNDVGYQTTSDQAIGVTVVGYQQYLPGRVFRDWSINTNQWYGTTLGGERITLGGNINGSFRLLDYRGGWGGINHERPVYATTELRGGPALLTPSSTNAWLGFYTDSRKPLVVEVGGEISREGESGLVSWQFYPEVRYRAGSRLTLSLEPSYARNRRSFQYVTDEAAGDSTHYVFAALDRTTLSLTMRLGYIFSPTLSLQFYAQPYLTSADYSDFKAVADPRAATLRDRFRPYAAGTELHVVGTGEDRELVVDADRDGAEDFRFDDPDFSFVEMRTNTVLRWEWRPGSTLFLVWSQGRNAEGAYGRFRFRRNVGDLIDAGPGNIFLLKVSYWLGA